MFVEYLSSMKVFEALNKEEISAIAEIAYHKNIEKDTHLFHMGEGMTNVYFVVKGNMKIYLIDEEDREQIINFLAKNEMFPHHAILRSDPYLANALSTENSEVVFIDKGTLKV
ncbi:Crp/Fnr family transcriptional regulator [Salinicoccus roseus]|uniref:Crp/Fnr family transcriptional regulator n=1 Tax=Salinicoccus roseus TaxID=45670 RepID=UPI000F50C902|nr:cyclic nucleotide-binding domain-containing protein [Salinicoccus roseus]GGA75569.1 hypothetical protein GCM10007176_19850 [Salinicoccus roseus]